jgi:hypothetical protein
MHGVIGEREEKPKERHSVVRDGGHDLLGIDERQTFNVSRGSTHLRRARDTNRQAL